MTLDKIDMYYQHLTFGYFIIVLMTLAIVSLLLCEQIKRYSKRMQVTIKIILIIIITIVIGLYLHYWNAIMKLMI